MQGTTRLRQHSAVDAACTYSYAECVRTYVHIFACVQLRRCVCESNISQVKCISVYVCAHVYTEMYLVHEAMFGTDNGCSKWTMWCSYWSTSGVELDYLISKQPNSIVSYMWCTDAILEALGQSLTLLQALQDLGALENIHGYVPTSLVKDQKTSKAGYPEEAAGIPTTFGVHVP